MQRAKPEVVQPDFEIIIPAQDTRVGQNWAREPLYERADGSRYRMRFDRKTKPNGYPDFGGDLAPWKTIVLVACASRKQEKPARACDLYISDLFKKSRAYAEAHGDAWYILSAAHGLLDPATVVEPYDKTLNASTRAQREQWARAVTTVLAEAITGPTRLIVLAGILYREPFLTYLLDTVSESLMVEVPMMGLGIGQQLAWLKKESEEQETTMRRYKNDGWHGNGESDLARVRYFAIASGIKGYSFSSVAVDWIPKDNDGKSSGCFTYRPLADRKGNFFKEYKGYPIPDALIECIFESLPPVPDASDWSVPAMTDRVIAEPIKRSGATTKRNNTETAYYMKRRGDTTTWVEVEGIRETYTGFEWMELFLVRCPDAMVSRGWGIIEGRSGLCITNWLGTSQTEARRKALHRLRQMGGRFSIEVYIALKIRKYGLSPRHQ